MRLQYIMEACSPGVGNHSRKEKTENNPNTERKKQYREFNRIMRVGKNIKKDNKGMYYYGRTPFISRCQESVGAQWTNKIFSLFILFQMSGRGNGV